MQLTFIVATIYAVEFFHRRRGPNRFGRTALSSLMRPGRNISPNQGSGRCQLIYSMICTTRRLDGSTNTTWSLV